MAKIICLESVLHLFALAAMASDEGYLRDVKPVLKQRCYACHGALKQASGLRLDTGLAICKGGDHGAVIVPGDPASSWLVDRIMARSESERMPPEGQPLKPAEVEAIKNWIANGAKSPSNEQAERDPLDHWAFIKPNVSSVPALDLVVGSPSGAANAIDAFLEWERRSRKLIPVGLAPKSQQLRRVYLDLIGLPPTRGELLDFLADQRPDAYVRTVDRLLASPRYGERWARHWMDVWRYADWYGLGAQLRNSQKHIWHWRDWIVESLNRDKGYDRMVLEMLAADEIAPTDQNSLRATGFLARNYYLFNRTTWLDNTIEHTSKAFLGLTMNCTKCHDHKYDPITQADYYRLRAIFEPHQVRLDAVPGVTDLEQDGIPRAFDAHPDAATYIHLRGDPKNPDKSRVVQPGTPRVFAFAGLRIDPIHLPLEAHVPRIRSHVLEDHLDAAQRAIGEALKSLEQKRAQLATLDDQDTRCESLESSSSGRLPENTVSRPKAVSEVRLAEKLLAAAGSRPAVIRTSYAADVSRIRGEISNLDVLVKAAVRASRKQDLADAEVELARLELALLENSRTESPNADEQLNQLTKKINMARKSMNDPGEEYASLKASRKALEGPDETEQSRTNPIRRSARGAERRWLGGS